MYKRQAIITLSFSSEAKKSYNQSHTTEINNLQLLKKIIKIVNENYVSDVEQQDLFYNAFDGMLHSLDPHSGFLKPEDFKEMNVQTKGEFGGVGIEITMDRGVLKVVSPIDDTPAYVAKIKPSDYITMIDGVPVRDLNINQAVQKIRGPVGSKVKLTIVREGKREPFDVSLTRAIIKIASVKSKILGEDIGYFRITSFSQNTSVSLAAQYKKLQSKLGKGFAGIILDLRNNPGGLLDQACLLYTSDAADES